MVGDGYRRMKYPIYRLEGGRDLIAVLSIEVRALVELGNL